MPRHGALHHEWRRQSICHLACCHLSSWRFPVYTNISSSTTRLKIECRDRERYSAVSISISSESDKTPLNGFSPPYLRCPDRHYCINAPLLLRRHCRSHAGSRRGYTANATGRFVADADRNGAGHRHTGYTHSHAHRDSFYTDAFAVYARSICDADDAAYRHAHAKRDADRDTDGDSIPHGYGHAYPDARASHCDLYQPADGHVYAHGRANRETHGRANRDSHTDGDANADGNAGR